MNEEFYTVREISQIYKISTSTLYKKLECGEITAYKIGRNWKIPKSSMEHILYISLQH